MEFGQLVVYNKRSIFLAKSHTKCGGEAIPRPLSKKSKLSISLDQYVKVYTVCLYRSQVEDHPKILKLNPDHLLLPHIKLFSETKRGLELDSFPHFLYDFQRKTFLLLHFIKGPKFHCLVALNMWDFEQYVYCNCILTDCDVINFEINLISLVNPFFLHGWKVNTKI